MPDIATLNVLNQFDFWSAVPVDGTATHEQIAKHTSLPVEVVQRTLDHAVTMRYFARPEPTSTSVKHTSRSAALAKDAGLKALVQMVLDETSPPMMLLPEALRRFAVGKEEISRVQKVVVRSHYLAVTYIITSSRRNWVFAMFMTLVCHLMSITISRIE